MGKIPHNVHFIGIGGVGMSGLAALLLLRGHRVTGSDLKPSALTERLQAQGATVYKGHKAENVGAAELVVVSSAIGPENPELLAARERGIPVMRRGELLSAVLRGYRGIAVAGAHGKTTTTAMVGAVLMAGGLDPTILVGGNWPAIGGNFRMGGGPCFVTEADESDASFLLLSPEVAAVTNIENDHLDYYGSVENLIRAFRDFLGRVAPGGIAVVCWDDPNLRALAREAPKPVVSYGVGEGADWRVAEVSLRGPVSEATLYFRGERIGRLRLNIPGMHNLLNAAGAVAVGHHLGVPFAVAAGALEGFRGVGRRFELLGKARGVTVIDDYAHHPTEIAATIRMARQLAPKRVVAVFQPHRYTRTALLYPEFGRAFSEADVVVVGEIYNAGEKPIPGVSADLIREAIRQHDRREVLRLPNTNGAAYVKELVQPGDIVLTLGAGDIYKVGQALVALLEADNG
ncbi:UDP-N-acetylmuramate--L-alanine ligase [Thermodesulfitimonas autotrophica]|uniref:UDP-N-acetylmuramate--L-alanine ligase n=1 Tax=Thermodesulfitimonas autotrophica TaxID=1894989 RepID=A0A3N5ANV7_9THEO|nr:UDP-N-acetylmuramate--L-alanine ligase [Thermodesulfitimonas autotrophica]RPF46779.1 UDP-N-acetylmuramate--L-alanine ligase [Thermodesulfitimonas autotrophica]